MFDALDHNGESLSKRAGNVDAPLWETVATRDPSAQLARGHPAELLRDSVQRRRKIHEVGGRRPIRLSRRLIVHHDGEPSDPRRIGGHCGRPGSLAGEAVVRHAAVMDR